MSLVLIGSIQLTFLQTEILMKVRLMGEHQVINGSIKDLSILAGIYNPAKRSDWIYQVRMKIRNRLDVNNLTSRRLNNIYLLLFISGNQTNKYQYCWFYT